MLPEISRQILKRINIQPKQLQVDRHLTSPAKLTHEFNKLTWT